MSRSSIVFAIVLAAIAALAGPGGLWAAGADTNAGTTVTNSVLLTWDAGQSVGNTASGAATFVVDRNVLFTNVSTPGAVVDVFPGDANVLVEFDLVNSTNGPLDLLLSLPAPANLPSAYDLFRDSDADNTCTAVDLAAALAVTYLDEVPEDANRTVCLYLDAGSLAADGTTYVFTLAAQAAEPGAAGVQGAALVNGNNAAWQAGTVQNAFGEAAGPADVNYDGLYTALASFRVVRANLTVTKVITGIVDGAGYTTVDKAIPGAVVSYLVTITNAGTGAAQNVTLTDTLSASIDVNADVSNIAVSTGSTVTNDSNPDTIVWTVGTVNPAAAPTLSYDVTIP